MIIQNTLKQYVAAQNVTGQPTDSAEEPKIVVQRFVLGAQNDKAAVVFGPDLPTVQERAFLRLDAATTIPLKKQWIGWLWDEIMQPEQLYSFGDPELHYAYLVLLPTDEELETLVLQAVRDNHLN